MRSRICALAASMVWVSGCDIGVTSRPVNVITRVEIREPSHRQPLREDNSVIWGKCLSSGITQDQLSNLLSGGGEVSSSNDWSFETTAVVTNPLAIGPYKTMEIQISCIGIAYIIKAPKKVFESLPSS